MANWTIPGSELPRGSLPPTLLFHRWHRYDEFYSFERKETAEKFFTKVAGEVQQINWEHYAAWHERFAAACDTLCAAEPLVVTTLWRLAVGWGTNPALEVGLTLDHLLGFPHIPGSAVKGLLHRMAEQELLESIAGEPPIPPAPSSGELPESPPGDLLNALDRARLVRALFGSLHLERGMDQHPEAPRERLETWAKLLQARQVTSMPWIKIGRALATLLSETATGGMVTCFDAVPSRRMFDGDESRHILTRDTLTPHKDNKPNPILFLAVRDGVELELRYRLAPWPVEEPRDEAETERAAALHGLSRVQIDARIRRWLGRAFTELGAGGKTTAGYGYFLAPGHSLADVKFLAPPAEPVKRDERSEAERHAAKVLPDGVDSSTAINELDKALDLYVKTTGPAERERGRAVAKRYHELFPSVIDKMRTSPAPTKQERVRRFDRVLGEDKS